MNTGLPGPTCRGTHGFARLDDASRHGVYQNIVVVTRHEIHFAANGWHAKTVAIVANTLHHTSDEMFHARIVGCTETQGVERCNWARTHGENITVNTANTRCSPLIRFDGRRVVVTFNFKHTPEIIADIYQTGILFACAHEQAFAGSWKGFELKNAIFIGHLPSLHITEKILSSVKLGTRPSTCLIF